MITFRSSISTDHAIEPFPRGQPTDLSNGSGPLFPPHPPEPVIAPFLADLNFTGAGGLYVRIIREEDGPEEFGDTTKVVIDENPIFSGFQPKTAVIATWFKPMLLSGEAEDLVNLISWGRSELSMWQFIVLISSCSFRGLHL